MRVQETPKDGISVEQALEKSIGQFGPGQWPATLMADFVWLITAMQAYLMVLAENDPVNQGYWECTSSTDSPCQAIYELENLKDRKEEFCNMDASQWTWSHPDVSIVATFGVQCDDFMVGLVKSLFFVGWMIGAGALGYLSDRYGRRLIMYVSMVISMVSMLASAGSPSYALYVICRLVAGIGCGGQGTASFVLVSELVGPSIRGKHSFFAQVQFVAGCCLIVVYSQFFDSWRYLTLAVGLSVLPFFLTVCWIPESPRWLVLNNKREQALVVLEKIAKANKREMPKESIVEKHSLSTNQAVKETFKNPTLRVWLAIMLATWLIVCIVYYGLALVMDDLPGSYAFKFLMLEASELAALILYFFLIDVVGRKPLYVGGFFIGGICCILVAFVPKIAGLVLATIGKFGVAGVFAQAFLYSSELFPTPVRNLALGSSSLFARIGGILAPQIALTAGILGSHAPFFFFGAAGLLAAILSLGLPETLGKPMPDTIRETELFIHTSDDSNGREQDSLINDTSKNTDSQI